MTDPKMWNTITTQSRAARTNDSVMPDRSTSSDFCCCCCSMVMLCRFAVLCGGKSTCVFSKSCFRIATKWGFGIRSCDKWTSFRAKVTAKGAAWNINHKHSMLFILLLYLRFFGKRGKLGDDANDFANLFLVFCCCRSHGAQGESCLSSGRASKLHWQSQLSDSSLVSLALEDFSTKETFDEAKEQAR